MACLAPPKAVESNLSDFGFETTEFRVAVNAKTFKILIDGLYQDKITSIQRELGTNAYDAHLGAGCPERPFLVKLPNTLDTSFSIRDFGTSMDHEDIMNMYVTIFESSKDKSNDQVGSFGLGSKSPFSYTDSFTVRAWKDGLQRDYIVGYNSEGIPTITKVNEQASEEETGLEVSFAVGWKDYSAFQHAAKNVFQWFPTLPIIPDLDLAAIVANRKPLLSGDDWVLIASPNYSNQLAVRQGCVVYPVNDTSTINARSILSLGYYVDLVLDVPIGSVSVTASREALSLDDSTVAFLRSRLVEIKKELSDKANDAFNNAPSLMQALLVYDDLKGKVYGFNPEEYKRPGMNKAIPIRNGNIEYSHKKNTRLPKLVALGGQTTNQNGSWFLNPKEIAKALFIVDRGQKMLRKKIRLREYMKDSWYGQNVKRGKESFILLENPTNDQLKTLMRFLELRPDQIVSIAALPDVAPPVRVGASSTGKKSGIYSAEAGGLYRVESDEDVADEFYWMPIDKATGSMVNYDSQLGYGYDVDNFYSATQHLAAWLELPKRPVYFFTSNAMKRIKPEAEDKYDVAMLALITDDVQNHVRKMYQASQYRRYMIHDFLCSPEIVALADEWKKCPSGSNAFAMAFRGFTDYMDVDILENDKKKLEEKYPMLYPYPSAQAQKEYVEMINKQLENK